ncbi:MAG: divergent polysaccharide deacetylase family protein [bacterium]|nr:divergent polysaccharide deacetylase family protein [bacterium]
MLNRFKSFFSNPKIAYAGIGVLALMLCFSLVFARTPSFPDDLPSAENLDIRTENYQAQKDFARRLSAHLRQSHGGLLLFKQTDRVASVEGLGGHGYVSYLQKFNRIKEERLFDLAQAFAVQEGLGIKIKKLTPNQGSGKVPRYELDFLKEGNLWVRVEAQRGAQAKIGKKPEVEPEILDKPLAEAAPLAVPAIDTDSFGEQLAANGPQGRLVIIIDDMGQNMGVFERFAKLNSNLTFSVLPQLSHSTATAEMAHRMGLEVMLHMPMQPMQFPEINPGVGALLTSDNPETLMLKLRKNFASVPHAIGVNNHMGSAFTQDASGMAEVMKELSAQGMFFLDSRTAASTTSLSEAKKYAVPFFSRNLFLDQDPSKEAVHAAFLKAMELAKSQGIAVAIGHPREDTLAVLKEMLPLLKAAGIELVRASELTKG